MFKKCLIMVTAFVASIGFYGNNYVLANAETGNAYDVVDTDSFVTYFGSGYRHYEDSVQYDIEFLRDGRMSVEATCLTDYSPEELDGDYIKFCTISYDSNKFFVRPYWGYCEDEFEEWKLTYDYNGKYFIKEESTDVNGVVTESIWCKHADFGIKAQTVFCFNLLPTDECVNDDIVFCGRAYHLQTDDFIVDANSDLPEGIIPNCFETSSTDRLDDITKVPLTYKDHVSTETTVATTETTVSTTTTIVQETAPVAPAMVMVQETTPITPTTVVTEQETTTAVSVTTKNKTIVEVKNINYKPSETEVVEETTEKCSESSVDDSSNNDNNDSVFDVNRDGKVDFNDFLSFLAHLFNK